MKLRYQIIPFLVAVAVSVASAAKPSDHALAKIDLNREVVVDAILAQWQHELPSGARPALAQKLSALRADQIFAARLAHSADGMLEVINSASLVERALGIEAQTLPELIAFASPTDAEDFTETVPIARDGLIYVSLATCRIVDTRSGNPFGMSKRRETRAFVASSRDSRHFTAQGGAGHDCNIPSYARALMANVTVVGSTELGYVAAAAAGSTPDHAIIAFPRNAAALTFAKSGLISLARKHEGDFVTLVTQGGLGTAHVIVDVVGYYAPPLLQRPSPPISD